MVEPYPNSLTPDNIGKPPENAILERNEVSIAYETSLRGIIRLIIKCSVCHQTLDTVYARGGGFIPGEDLLLIEPHKCPGKILTPKEAATWDLKHRQLYKDKKWCPPTLKWKLEKTK